MYAVFGFLKTFPIDSNEISEMTYLHVGFVIISSEMVKISSMTAAFAVIFKVADKRMAAFSMTMLATIHNVCITTHKTYVYYLIEEVGIYNA
jgi:hypothetical protein